MSNSSNIEWTDATWNPVVGCSRVSVPGSPVSGCDHCYAVGMTRRLEGMAKGGPSPGKGRTRQYIGLTVELKPAVVARGVGVNGRHFSGEVRCVEEALPVPLRWRKPRKVFVNSMADLFHERVPFEFIDRVFAVMNATQHQLPIPEDVTRARPWHTYQVLTKRPERMCEYVLSRAEKFPLGEHPLFRERNIFRGHGPHVMNASGGLCWPLPNVWLGVSVWDQPSADAMIPHLLRTPAAMRFVSYEPALGPVDFAPWLHGQEEHGAPLGGTAGACVDWTPPIDWLIYGGESGGGARPNNVEWARSTRDQCRDAGVAFYLKQLGAWPYDPGWHGDGTPDGSRMSPNNRKGSDMREWPEDLRVRQMPTTTEGGAA